MRRGGLLIEREREMMCQLSVLLPRPAAVFSPANPCAMGKQASKSKRNEKEGGETRRGACEFGGF